MHESRRFTDRKSELRYTSSAIYANHTFARTEVDKELEQMSLKELWQLFPISLVEHNKEWETWYLEEEKAILSLIPEKYITRISHIGSTAVPYIWAKDIIDILLEVPDPEDLEPVKNFLIRDSWLRMSQSLKRISLNKGYTKQGFADKVFHLHIRIAGDNDELYFRDYLIDNIAIAEEYEELKLHLWNKFEHDRDGYTSAKSSFIKMYTDIAKEEYKGRY